MNEGREVVIYGLVCPINSTIMYVGKSLDEALRLRQHMYDAKRGYNTRKDEWLRQLMALGLEPAVVVLDRCTEHLANDREREWIKHYRSLNPGLTNIQSGGSRCSVKRTVTVSKVTRTRGAWIDEGRMNTAMKAAGLETDKDLATASGVDERTIRNIKSNGSGSFEVWTKLAEACGCNPIDLLVTPGFPDPNWAALAALSI